MLCELWSNVWLFDCVPQMSLAGTAPATIAAQEAAEFKSRDQQWQALLRAPRAPSQGGPPIAAQAAAFKPEGFQSAGAFQSRGNPGPFQSTAAPNAAWAQAPPPATAFGSSPFRGIPATGFGGVVPASGFGGGAAASGGSQIGTFGAGFGSRLGAVASVAPTGQSRQGITFGGGGRTNPTVPVQFGQPQAQQQGPATQFGSGVSRPTFGGPFGGGGTPGAGFTSAPGPFQAVAPSATLQKASPVGGAPFGSAAFPGQALSGVSPASGAPTALPPQGALSSVTQIYIYAIDVRERSVSALCFLIFNIHCLPKTCKLNVEIALVLAVVAVLLYGSAISQTYNML